MVKELLWLGLVAAFASEFSFGLPGTTEEGAQAVLSDAGKRRVKENVEILSENVRTLESNLDATRKNLETIEQELKDLEALENEHLELDKRYSTFLSESDAAAKKNEAALTALGEWEKANVGASSEEIAKRRETARLEQMDRKRFKEETEAKLAKMLELKKGTERGLRDIRGRREPLVEQKKIWSQRSQEFRKLLEETLARKVTLEAQLRQ